ncbi:HPF/RaiA family ribosome-associated protein [Massilia sp. W12]|uniref:HPF/RaiA family ribosome-associated protein n=1 Tax=Massilia sp. W12 TaxID=3126507 RepID=UPI0030D219AA
MMNSAPDSFSKSNSAVKHSTGVWRIYRKEDAMLQVIVNADNSVELHEPLMQHVEKTVRDALHHFAEQITRVEVHLSEANREKGADGENRCLIEARVAHQQPIAVSDNGPSLHQAIAGAADKLKRSVDSALGRLHEMKVRSGRTEH